MWRTYVLRDFHTIPPSPSCVKVLRYHKNLCLFNAGYFITDFILFTAQSGAESGVNKWKSIEAGVRPFGNNVCSLTYLDTLMQKVICVKFSVGYHFQCLTISWLPVKKLYSVILKYNPRETAGPFTFITIGIRHSAKIHLHSWLFLCMQLFGLEQ